MSTGRIWRKTIFHHVRISNGIFFSFAEKIRQCRDNCSLRVRRKHLRDFLFTFWLPKTILDFHGKFSARFQSCIFIVRRTILKEMCLFAKKKRFFLNHLLNLGRKNFEIRQKFLVRFVEIAFYASSGKLQGKTNFRIFFYIFPHFSNLNDLFFFGKKIGTGLSKLYSKCPEEIIEEMILFGEFIFFYQFGTRSQKFSALCRKLFNRVVKNAFNLSRGKIWGKRFFLYSSLFHFFPIFVRNF